MGSAVSDVTGTISDVGGLVGGVVGAGPGGLVGGLGKTITKTSGAQSDYQAQVPDVETNQLPNSVGAFGQNLRDENNFAAQLLAQSQGQGPNLGQAQMNLATGQNAASAASLLASQRSLNPGLAAQLAAQQQTNANQQAAAQSAYLNAQTQLGSENLLSGVYGNIGTQANSNIGVYNNLLAGTQNTNANTALGNAQVAGGVTGGLLGGGGAAGASYVKGGAAAAAHGGRIQGKAPVPGDSYANDTVNTLLSPGEIVIPRSKAESPDQAKAFIDELMKTEGKKAKLNQNSESGVGFGHVLKAHRELQTKMKEMNALLKGLKK